MTCQHFPPTWSAESLTSLPAGGDISAKVVELRMSTYAKSQVDDKGIGAVLLRDVAGVRDKSGRRFTPLRRRNGALRTRDQSVSMHPHCKKPAFVLPDVGGDLWIGAAPEPELERVLRALRRVPPAAALVELGSKGPRRVCNDTTPYVLMSARSDATAAVDEP